MRAERITVDGKTFRAEMTPVGALEASALGQAMRQWLWLYPSWRSHISGIALLFGSHRGARPTPARRLEARAGESARSAGAALERRRIPAHRAERLADVRGPCERFIASPGSC